MKTFVSQLCFGLSVLVLSGCGGDDDGGSSPATSTGGAGGTGGGSTSGGGSGGSAGNGEAGGGGASNCEPTENELAIAGVYHDGYDGAHRVDDEVWVQGTSSFKLLDFSNEEHWAIARNDSENEYFPGDFSRFDWTLEHGQLYYCQTEYDAASEDEARDAEPADASDLAGGCGAGGFAWSSLTPINLVGSYLDQYGGPHTITASAWLSGPSLFHLLDFSNDETWAVARNDCANAYFPGLYSRFEWLVVEGGEGGAAGAAGAGGAAAAGSTYFCQIGYDEASQVAARQLPPADRANLKKGCNGFPWSRLTPNDL